MSLTGVSHSCMVELHANVACMRNHPATKHVPTSTGTLVVRAHIILAAISTAPDASSCVRVENRNLMRNITAKFIDMPVSEAYPAMRISSCMSAVVPTMSVAAARYTPPANCTMSTKKMNRYGFNRRGTKSGTSGMSNGPCGACRSAISVFYFTFHIHACAQSGYVVGAVVAVKLDSHRNALAHLHEISGRVVLR